MRPKDFDAAQARAAVKFNDSDVQVINDVLAKVVDACNNGMYSCDTGLWLPDKFIQHFRRLGYDVGTPYSTAFRHFLYWYDANH